MNDRTRFSLKGFLKFCSRLFPTFSLPIDMFKLLVWLGLIAFCVLVWWGAISLLLHFLQSIRH